MERDRSWRRGHAERKQRNRLRKNLETGFWKPEWVKEEWVGMLRDGHFGCGCPMCKPWKHGAEEPYRVSERRRLQNKE